MIAPTGGATRTAWTQADPGTVSQALPPVETTFLETGTGKSRAVHLLHLLAAAVSSAIFNECAPKLEFLFMLLNVLQCLSYLVYRLSTTRAFVEYLVRIQ